MKLHGAVTINGKRHAAGSEIPWYFIYPFFLVHMGAFGLSGFYMAYASDGPELSFLYMHGGFACFVYLIFYTVFFGVDRIRWMFINAGLGLFGIYAEIDWILSGFGKRVGDYSVAVHVIPFLYYVLYTFLLRQLLLDVTRSRDNPTRKRWVETGYVIVSVLVYGLLYLQRPG